MHKELYIEHSSVSQDQIFRKNSETQFSYSYFIFIIAVYLFGIRFSLLINGLVSKRNVENKLYILSTHDAQRELEQCNLYHPAYS